MAQNFAANKANCAISNVRVPTVRLSILRMSCAIRKHYVLGPGVYPDCISGPFIFMSPATIVHCYSPVAYLGFASAIAARYMRFCCNLAWYCAHSCSFPMFWFSRIAKISCSFSFKYF